MAKKNGIPVNLQQKSVRLDYCYSDDTQVAKFTDHMVVQRGQHEVHLSFFQANYPIIVGAKTADEMQEQIEKITSLPARCVSRVVLAADRLPEFIGILQSIVKMTQPDGQATTNSTDEQ